MRFTLEPDADLENRQIESTIKELAAHLKTLTPEDLEGLKKDTAALEALQEATEDLASLPTLELSDVPADIEIIRPDELPAKPFSTCYEKATSGILYFTCPMGAGTIDPTLFPLVPFFCRAFTGSGTKKSSYEKIAQKIDLYTGGVFLSPFSGSYFSPEADAHSFLAIQGKALDRNIPPLFDLMAELIQEVGFKDLDRIKNMLLQYRAGMESAIVSTGHRYAIQLASRHLSQASYINDLWHGIAQYQLIKSITDKISKGDGDQETLLDLTGKFKKIADSILKKDNLKPALIGAEDAIGQADHLISRIHDQLPDTKDASFFTPPIDYEGKLPHDGWSTNTSVSFVAQSFKAVRITHPDSPGLSVIAKLLRSLFLHREIREKGGAYGGFAMYNPEEGLFSFASYRDPHIDRTLEVYKKACDFIMQGNFTQTDIKEAILQVCSEIDKPETPGPAAMKAFYRGITKLDDTIRQNFKDALLKLNKQQIIDIAGRYFSVDDDQKGTAVISSQTALEQANTKMNRPLNLFKI